MDPELLERISARRAELDELEEHLAKQSASMCRSSDVTWSAEVNCANEAELLGIGGSSHGGLT